MTTHHPYSKSQSGSVHIVIVSILTLALVGALGFIFWQNFISKSSHTDNTVQVSTAKVVASSSPAQGTAAKVKAFNGGFGVTWVAFNYPADWTIDSDASTLGGSGGGVGPGIIIKSPEFKILSKDQGEGISGDYIHISSTTAVKSLASQEADQGAADPGGTFGDFTFAGKPAQIFESESEFNGKKPPMPTLADMYKGVDTWVQGPSIIYTFDSNYETNPSGSGFSVQDGDATELFSALKTVFDSLKWQ
jgi:hypothetical protein